MTPSKDLFDLIKSLNKSEKGYFKKFSSFHTRGELNNYVRLFDVIEQQKEYDETKVLKFFKGEKLVNNFSVAKAYLYDLILKSLESFHSDIDSQLQSFLHRIKILNEKELYLQSKKILDKAIQLAEKYEKYPYLLLLIKYKLQIMHHTAYEGVKEATINDEYQLFDKIVEKIMNVKEYDRIKTQIFSKRRKEGLRVKAQDMVLYDTIKHGKLFESDKKALSKWAMADFYLCKGLYFFTVNNYKEAQVYIEKSILHFEENKPMIEDNPQAYASAINNLIILKNRMKKYAEIPVLANKMRSIQTNSPAVKNYIFYTSNRLESTMYTHTGQFEAGIKLINRMNTSVINNSSELSLGLKYNMARIYFGAGNYSAANIYINDILNASSLSLRNDVYCNARIMSLFIHLEMKKIDLVEYRLKSVLRTLNKWKDIYPLEAAIVKVVEKKLKVLYSTDDVVFILEEIRNKITEISSKHAISDNTLNNNFFVSWLESKIQKKSFAAMLMAKSKMVS